MVRCPRSSHGDKVLNCPIVLEMWDVTLMDVPQWILLDLVWRKSSTTLSLHGWHCPFNTAAGRIWKAESKYVDSLRGQCISSCLSLSVRALRSLFAQLKWPCVVFILERKTDSFSTDLIANTPHDCQSPALCKIKSLEKYHLSKQSIFLLGVLGQKVRGNPWDYHFRSCQWRRVTLSGFTPLLYAVLILKRLNCALALCNDTELFGDRSEQVQSIYNTIMILLMFKLLSK